MDAALVYQDPDGSSPAARLGHLAGPDAERSTKLHGRSEKAQHVKEKLLAFVKHQGSLVRGHHSAKNARHQNTKSDLNGLSPEMVTKLKDWADTARGKVAEWHEIRDRRLIMPDSNTKASLDVLNIALMLWTFFELPFSAVFGDELHGEIPECERIWTSFGVINLIVDFLFMLDVVTIFNTAYYNSESELVLSRYEIAKTYAKGWFLLDFTTSIPFHHLVCGFTSENVDTFMLRMIKFLRLLKLSRIAKFSRILHRWELQMGSRKLVGMLRMVKFSTVLIFVAHISACVWMLLSQFTDCNPEVQEHCICTANGCYTDNWLASYDMEMFESKRVSSKYLASIYYAIVTLSTVGYGDITAASDIERLVALLLALLGAVIFAWCIGSISELASDENRTEVSVKDQVREVSDFLQYANLPRQTQVRVQQQLLYASKKAPHRMHQCLDHLPRSMKDDIVDKIFHREIAKDIPWLSNLDRDARTRLAWLLKPLRMKRREFLCHALESAEEMYFLLTGEVAAINGSDGRVVAKMMPGSLIGEISLFEETLPFRTFSMQALTDCELLILEKQDLNNIIRPQLPDLYMAIKDLALTKFSFLDKDGLVKVMKDQSMRRCAHVHEQLKSTRKAMRHNVVERKPDFGDVGVNALRSRLSSSDQDSKAVRRPSSDIDAIISSREVPVVELNLPPSSAKNRWMKQLGVSSRRTFELVEDAEKKSSNATGLLKSGQTTPEEQHSDHSTARAPSDSHNPPMEKMSSFDYVPGLEARDCNCETNMLAEQMKEQMESLERRLSTQIMHLGNQISRLANQMEAQQNKDLEDEGISRSLSLYGYTANRSKVTMSTSTTAQPNSPKDSPRSKQRDASPRRAGRRGDRSPRPRSPARGRSTETSRAQSSPFLGYLAGGKRGSDTSSPVRGGRGISSFFQSLD